MHVVTNWVQGTNLKRYLAMARAGKRVWPSPTEAFKRYRGLAHALSQMHVQAGVIHGDLKPGNMILTSRPSRLVVTDFGSAWSIERTALRLAGDGATRGYAAPEQLVNQRRVDFRADQFSATVVLYEMLTGKLPYGGMGGCAGLPENERDHGDSLILPSQDAMDRRYIPARIWAEIDQVVIRGLALDPSQRFASSREWRNATDAVCRMFEPPLDNAVGQPRLPNLMSRISRFLRRGDAADRC
jgi:serine/threonine-protein kinase